jgi:hypothetical protein
MSPAENARGPENFIAPDGVGLQYILDREGRRKRRRMGQDQI